MTAQQTSEKKSSAVTVMEKEDLLAKLNEMEVQVQDLSKEKFIMQTFIQSVKEFVPNDAILQILNEYCECMASLIEQETSKSHLPQKEPS